MRQSQSPGWPPAADAERSDAARWSEAPSSRPDGLDRHGTRLSRARADHRTPRRTTSAAATLALRQPRPRPRPRPLPRSATAAAAAATLALRRLALASLACRSTPLLPAALTPGLQRGPRSARVPPVQTPLKGDACKRRRQECAHGGARRVVGRRAARAKGGKTPRERASAGERSAVKPADWVRRGRRAAGADAPATRYATRARDAARAWCSSGARQCDEDAPGPAARVAPGAARAARAARARRSSCRLHLAQLVRRAQLRSCRSRLAQLRCARTARAWRSSATLVPLAQDAAPLRSALVTHACR